jgi:hypothetical protein
MSYTANETALTNLIIANISGYASSNCKCGDADSAFNYAVKNNANVCILDPYGAVDDSQQDAFGNNENWTWNILVSFFILYDKDTIETSVRSLKDSFTNMRRDNKRLSTSSVWRIREEREFEPVKNKYSDRPYVPVIFVVSCKDPL